MERGIEEPSKTAGFLLDTPGSSSAAQKRPTTEFSGPMPKKARTTPKMKPNITPEPTAKRTLKQKIRTTQDVVAEEGASQELVFVRPRPSPEQIIEDVYTPHVPGLKKSCETTQRVEVLGGSASREPNPAPNAQSGEPMIQIVEENPSSRTPPAPSSSGQQWQRELPTRRKKSWY